MEFDTTVIKTFHVILSAHNGLPKLIGHVDSCLLMISNDPTGGMQGDVHENLASDETGHLNLSHAELLDAKTSERGRWLSEEGPNALVLPAGRMRGFSCQRYPCLAALLAIFTKEGCLRCLITNSGTSTG